MLENAKPGQLIGLKTVDNNYFNFYLGICQKILKVAKNIFPYQDYIVLINTQEETKYFLKTYAGSFGLSSNPQNRYIPIYGNKKIEFDKAYIGKQNVLEALKKNPKTKLHYKDYKERNLIIHEIGWLERLLRKSTIGLNFNNPLILSSKLHIQQLGIIAN